MQELKPFLKWAGGKRWLAERYALSAGPVAGTYIEPFAGGAAVFFAARPAKAILSDMNRRLIETYSALRNDWSAVLSKLHYYHANHSTELYYAERQHNYDNETHRAAQFIYLNRACWNGLYRVNKRGQFNVPIGSKGWIISPSDDFAKVSEALQSAELVHCDFELSINRAVSGDTVFVDPPYTVAHNMNGFVKYNETIFSWSDQVRLADAVRRAVERGANVTVTNANHASILDLYAGFSEIVVVERRSVISGSTAGRKPTTELLIRCEV